MRSFRRAADLLLTVVFLAVITLPVVGLEIARQTIAPLTDKRAPVPRPPLAFDLATLVAFHHNFEHWWNHAFAFRPTLVRAYNALAVRLGVSPSNQVVIGKDGWWFVGDDYRAVEYQRAARPFTPQQLEEWRLRLETRRDWLAARGIAYLFVVAPDKATVYPQYFPTAQNRVGPSTRLDQLVRHLAEQSDVRLVDVRAALAAAKERAPVYEPLDSHWNDLGAWIAYAAIAERLHAWNPAIQPAPLDAFERRHLPGQGNDLAVLLSLGHRWQGNRLTLVPRQPRRARWVGADGELPNGSQGIAVSLVDDPTLPRAVMFHDSFAEALRPFLAEHFARAFYSWQALFDPAVVEREQPNVVIHEMVERTLLEDLPPDPDEVRSARVDPPPSPR